MILEILLPIFAVVAISVFFLWWFDPLRAIPGPPGLPLLGNTLDLTRAADVHSLTRKWQKKYGDIFKYYVLFGMYPSDCILFISLHQMVLSCLKAIMRFIPLLRVTSISPLLQVFCFWQQFMY